MKQFIATIVLISISQICGQESIKKEFKIKTDSEGRNMLTQCESEPNKNLCNGKADGNYEYPGKPNYVLSCVGGFAKCQPCWPNTLVFSQRCNQCLYTKDGKDFESIFYVLNQTKFCSKDTKF